MVEVKYKILENIRNSKVIVYSTNNSYKKLQDAIKKLEELVDGYNNDKKYNISSIKWGKRNVKIRGKSVERWNKGEPLYKKFMIEESKFVNLENLKR